MSTEEQVAAPPSPPEDTTPAADGTAPTSRSKPSSTKTKSIKTARARPSEGATGTSGKKSGAGSGGGNGDDKSFSIGDIVLARLRGYPPWPARIADPDDLPRNVSQQRPGKSPSIFCVQFFPVGDYDKSIRQYLSEPHRKASGGLRDAYETAQDPSEWDALQAEHRRKREADEAEVDELDEDDTTASGGKRKRAAGEKKAKAKKAKTDKKKSAADDVEEEEDDAPKSKSAKGKSEKNAPAPAPKSAQKEAAAEDDPLANDPECVKVKDWRHKLQRAFLGKGLPAAEEMETYDNMFKTIESYKDITIEALQYSKIGKVMKKIATLDGIPRNDEFKITDRASKLMQDWQNFIAANENKANGSSAHANGDAAETGVKTEQAAGNPPTPPAEEKVAGEGVKPEQSEADPAVNGTGESKA